MKELMSVYQVLERQVEEGKWTPAELEEFAQRVLTLAKKARQQNGSFAFFVSVGPVDPRKGKPYVARLYLDTSGKLCREFFELDYTWGKKSVHMKGSFEARSGDIIEIRWGGSWRNDYRYWYWVSSDGDLIEVADIGHAEEKAAVLDYLKTGDETVLTMKNVEERVRRID